MNFTIDRSNDVAIVRLDEARLMYPLLADFAGAVTGLLDGGDRKVLLDFSKVTYVDSATIGCLMDLYRQASGKGGALKLASVQKRVETMLTMTGAHNRVEFLIAPNPGEPLKPLVKVASGGETSRVMLALKTVLAVADETPTLIFDEIDQGIGGRVGSVVGRKLWELSHQGQHQTLCVTHLPQIAGYGDVHYHVAKQVAGARTQTQVRALSGEDQVEELAQMLGTLSHNTRQSARDILHEAAGLKSAEPGEQVAQGVLL